MSKFIVEIDIESGIVHVMVNDQKIGMISRLNISAADNYAFPQVEIDFLGGERLLNYKYEDLSPAVRAPLEESVSLLRNIPFIRVNVPMVPVI